MSKLLLDLDSSVNQLEDSLILLDTLHDFMEEEFKSVNAARGKAQQELAQCVIENFGKRFLSILDIAGRLLFEQKKELRAAVDALFEESRESKNGAKEDAA